MTGPRPVTTRLGRRVLIAFAVGVIVAVAEILVAILVSHYIGWWLTILLILVTSLLGAWVLRREGPRSWRAFRADLRERRPPGASATDGLLALLGGLLLVAPGFLTDLAGAVLVAPPTRRLVSGVVQSRLTRRLGPSAATTFFGPRTVKVRTGTPTAPPPPASTSGASTSATAGRPSADGGEPIEGEIID